MWFIDIKLTANRRVTSRKTVLLPLALALIIFIGACSSGGSSGPTPTPAGSGQIPVENPDGAGRPDSPVLTGDARRGFDSYLANGCSTCHSGGDISLGPSHLGIFETAGSRVDGLTAEEYIAQSIKDPDAFIVPGFDSPSIMPTFEELTDNEIRILIEYMKTIKVADEAPPVVSAGSLPEGVPEEGRRLYGAIGCSGCHSLGTDRIVGPGFTGVAARASGRKPGLTADEYMIESIIDPAIFIVPGFPRQMPSFAHLSDQEIADLLAFLKSLK